MKTLLLLLACTFSVNALSAPQCKHTPIPSIKGSLNYEATARSKVIKAGWKPLAITDEAVTSSRLYNKKIPEAGCSAPGCTYEYTDKYNNRLSIYAGDVVTEVDLSCSK
jgi:hypothetical protein